jgi:hypothetical protein
VDRIVNFKVTVTTITAEQPSVAVGTMDWFRGRQLLFTLGPDGFISKWPQVAEGHYRMSPTWRIDNDLPAVRILWPVDTPKHVTFAPLILGALNWVAATQLSCTRDQNLNLFPFYWSLRSQYFLYTMCGKLDENCMQTLIGRPEWKRPLGRPRHR